VRNSHTNPPPHLYAERSFREGFTTLGKLGGINMPVNGFGWHKRPAPPPTDELVAATRDYYMHSIEVFGTKRCMFESNFPVDRMSCSYNVLWNAFKKMAAKFSDDEKADLFHRTAARVYRLSV
jgi:L-fuconolactonase